MTQRMLIDARHAEETRVAVLQGNRIEEFDFESAEHKQIKGNIYLAKVTRVEPSLQAAFVDFGGNRHGFLAFSEIHPDYYQIPREDREALLAEEAAQAAEEEALRAAEDADDEAFEESGEAGYGGEDLDDTGGVTEIDTSEKDQVATIEAGHVENGFSYGEDENAADEDGNETEARSGDDDDQSRRRSGERRRPGGRGRSKEAEDLRNRRMALRRRYKIQDVIHRRQVLLVQVVKEERGNKGAALTTYLSLAGRYCVLMPNSSHGGGISRKISNAADRKRLKVIMGELSLPKSMGCIVRTAGLSRTKPEIKRDFDYLARLWDEIRENTLKSSAPALIHSDSDLIKRAIRDIYNRDIEDVIVEGEAGYRAARDFMKLLMPSHARRVKPYVDPVPLFQRYGAEDQLTAMYDPVVQLRSGGYIVINPTEALVSIDINSGRSTKEYGIEATALNTNLEAAREIARQLRLRDMAGLVVIDFIDMEHGSNVRKVEKAMKDALKNDRARIQVGRISSFGLMEMSRQRLRTGVLEATTRTCPHCDGSGLVRTASSAGLSALRLIEEEAAKGRGSIISLFASTEAAIYLLNAKRADLAEIEMRYGVRVEVIPEGENEGAKMRVVPSGPRPEYAPRFEPIVEIEDEAEVFLDDDDEEFEAEEETGGAPERESDARGEDGEGGRRRRRRRRGRGRDRGDEPVENAADTASESAEDDEAEAEIEGDETVGSEAGEREAADGEAPRKRRRRNRRRRGGRGRGEDGGETLEAGETESPADDERDEAEFDTEPEVGSELEPAQPPLEETAEEAIVTAPAKRTRRKKVVDGESEPTPAPARSRRRKADAEDAPAASDEASSNAEAVAPEAASTEAAAVKPKRSRRKKADVETADAEPGEPASAPQADFAPAIPFAQIAETVTEPALVSERDIAPAAEATADPNADGDPDSADGPRRGWWQRTFGN